MESSLCNECEQNLAKLACFNCEQLLCPLCDEKIHDKGKRKAHSRESLSQAPIKPSNQSLSKAMVCCISFDFDEKEGFLENKKQLKGFLDEESIKRGSSLIYLLIWNNQNEKVNKMLLSVQNELKQRVLVIFIRALTDFIDFLNNVKEKFSSIHYLIAQNISFEISSFLPNYEGNYNIDYFDNQYRLYNKGKLLENTIKKGFKGDFLNTPLKKSESPYNNRETPYKANFLESPLEKPLIPDFQAYKPCKSLPFIISRFIQDFLRFSAQEGILMLEKGDILTKLSSELVIKGLCTAPEAGFLLFEAEKAKLFHTTIRKFDTQVNIFYYISLHLETFSLEALIWVLKSLSQDKLTPTEKALLNRIKEAFCLKITPADFHSLLLSFTRRMDANSLIKAPKGLPSIVIEVSKEIEGFSLFLAWEKRGFEDQGVLSALNQEEWDEFLDFLRKFFFLSMSQASFKTVESLVEKQEPKRKGVFMNKKFLRRFIPGGKYGCCQYIKCCGTPRLKKVSFGRLTLFVQEAIERGLLEYYKTLLVATEGLREGKVDLTTKDIIKKQDIKVLPSQKLLEVKGLILKIIGSFPQGINLARLPKMIQFYTNVPFDCQDYGGKKLKDLLLMFPEVEMIEFGDNMLAKLKEIEDLQRKTGLNWLKVTDPMYGYKCYKGI